MSFREGKMNVRWFRLSNPPPANVVQLLAAAAVGNLSEVKHDQPVFGWANWNSALDGRITDETVLLGEFLRVKLVRAQKKVSPARFKAEFAIEKTAALKDSGRDFLSKGEKKALKRAVLERLLARVEPSLKETEVIRWAGTLWVAADAMSEGAGDELAIQWRVALGSGHKALALTPDTLTEISRDCCLTRYSLATGAEVQGSTMLGEEFLTWLWYASETFPGLLRVSDGLNSMGRLVGILIDGPLCFVGDQGGGAHVVRVSKGNPPISMEARSALLADKRLHRCTLAVSIDAEIWNCTFDAQDWTFRALRVPASKDRLDPVSEFQYRMDKACVLRDAMLGLFELFLSARGDRIVADNTASKMRTWIRERTWETSHADA